MAKRMKQLELPEPATHGGRRRGAGRKRGSGVQHLARPVHKKRFPLHVTVKFVPGLLSLRHWQVFDPIFEVIAQAARPGFSVVHFSVMGDHIHLIAEASDRDALSAAMRSFNTRIAQVVNRALHRTGPVVAERYHSRELRHRPEVRHVLVYVLLDWRKHFDKHNIDPHSNGPWFDG